MKQHIVEAFVSSLANLLISYAIVGKAIEPDRQIAISSACVVPDSERLIAKCHY